MNSALQATSDELVTAAFEGGNYIEILAKLALKILEIQLLQATGATEGGSKGGGFLGAAFKIVAGAVGSYFSGGLSNTGNAFGSSGSLFDSVTGAIALPNAEGGKIEGKGTGTSDSILSWLSDGEFVINADATRQNQSLLEAINDGKRLPRFADGGMVGNFTLPGMNAAQRFDNLSSVFEKGDLDSASSGGGRPVSVQMTINTPDAGSFRRSQSQVSAELGRMIQQGSRQS